MYCVNLCMRVGTTYTHDCWMMRACAVYCKLARYLSEPLCMCVCVCYVINTISLLLPACTGTLIHKCVCA